MRTRRALRFVLLGACAALVGACHAATDNQANAPSVPVVSTEVPAASPPAEASQEAELEAKVEVGPISLEPPPDVATPPPDAERTSGGSRARC